MAAWLLIFIGILFKAYHWPGANVSILLSAILMIVSLFAFAIKDNRLAGASDGLNYFMVGMLTMFIVVTIFRMQRWPGADHLVMVAFPLAFVFPLFLIFQKGEFKISRQFAITFFTYFILFISLFRNLAIPVSQS